MDLEENIEFILELWKCKTFSGENAKVNSEGMALCGLKYKDVCEYQYKEEGDFKCYCSRWKVWC